MPTTPRILYVSSIHLAAVLTAVSLSRAFVRQTLATWQLSDQIDSAELVVSELVTNTVKSTGFPDGQPKRQDITAQHIIGVQLRVVDARLYVEVWDRGDGTPAIPEQSLDAEGGRGLFLVASLSRRWDIYRPAVGGKVTWAELALTEPVRPPVPSRVTTLDAPDVQGPEAGVEVKRANLAFTQRFLGGVRHRPDVRVAG
jgi:anti-sigma regulatory factor (Ser/Thr protein kinase)